MDRPVRKLHPLLRLAVISGVETAVKLHIRRGDDLDARDGSGATPLILAAAKGKQGVVKLLLEAGANPTLVDPEGMDALAHAKMVGCSDTVDLLTEALNRMDGSKREALDVTSRRDNEQIIGGVSAAARKSSLETSDELAAELSSSKAEHPPSDLLGNDFCKIVATQSSRQGNTDERPAPDSVSKKILVTDAPSLDEEPLETNFEDSWEAEEESVAPEGDESIAEVAKLVHETIGRHRAVCGDEDWSDIDLYLPERAVPLEREAGDGVLRSLLLAALREGMVSEDALAEVCSGADGSGNEEAERLLGLVVAELGATVTKWIGEEGLFLGEPSLEEEHLLNEATEFAKELASGRNDPFRYYSKDIRGDLLEPEEEIELGREMEEAGRDALVALAQWPEGLAQLFEAADKVARGEVGAKLFSMGPEPSPDDEQIALAEMSDENDDEEADLDAEASAFVSAVSAVRAAKLDAQGVVEALDATRLTRRFLFELAKEGKKDPTGSAFANALERQSVARERMTLCNLRLALSITKKYLWSGLPFDDLLQEANIGLMKAVERYDWRRGFRFSTYATWWIRQQITRSIADTAKVVRAPVHIQETARKVIREREEVERLLGRPETEIETAERIGRPPSKTRLLLSLFEDVESLDEIDPETGLSRAELLLDPDAPDPAELAERASLRSTLLGMLDEFDERSRDVILLRFGLGEQDAMTLEEVGQHFGVTRERIRQIESKAMRKLSHRNRREILAPFMGDTYAPRQPSKTEAPISVETTSCSTGEPSGSDKSGDSAPALLIERPAPSFPPPRPAPDHPVAERPVPVRGMESAETRPSVEAPPTSAVFKGDRVSKLGEEARKLGLEVDDRRSEGGELRIIAPFDSTPTVRAFGRMLLASGFRKVQRDVFAK